jgi:hypothetical protein
MPPDWDEIAHRARQARQQRADAAEGRITGKVVGNPRKEKAELNKAVGEANAAARKLANQHEGLEKQANAGGPGAKAAKKELKNLVKNVNNAEKKVRGIQKRKR